MTHAVPIHPRQFALLTSAEQVVREKQAELTQAEQQLRTVFLTAITPHVEGPCRLVSADGATSTLTIETDDAPMEAP